MMSDDKLQVKSRFVLNGQAENDTTKIVFHLRQSDNVIGRVLTSKIPALINDYTHRQWRDLMTKELVEFIHNGTLAVIPVKIGNKAIGVLCAQYFCGNNKSKTNKTISTDDFVQLCSLVEHLNMCLTMIMMR